MEFKATPITKTLFQWSHDDTVIPTSEKFVLENCNHFSTVPSNLLYIQGDSSIWSRTPLLKHCVCP